jgi:hypothetical protein
MANKERRRNQSTISRPKDKNPKRINGTIKKEYCW